MVMDLAAFQTIYDTYMSRGYVQLPGFMPPDILDAYERTVLALYLAQGAKLPGVRQRSATLQDVGREEPLDQLHDVLTAFEHSPHGKEAAYQAYLATRITPAAGALMTCAPLVDLVRHLLSSEPSVLTCYGPDFYPRLPHNTRLMYHWHTEQPYYPYRRLFTKAWIPLFGPKTADNGTMLVRPHSHQHPPYPTSTFSGYSGAGGTRQIVIPERLLQDAPAPEPIVAERGDLVLLHPDLVHASAPNTSDRLSATTLLLFFDTRYDLTTAADPAARDPLDPPDLDPPEVRIHGWRD